MGLEDAPKNKVEMDPITMESMLAHIDKDMTDAELDYLRRAIQYKISTYQGELQRVEAEVTKRQKTK